MFASILGAVTSIFTSSKKAKEAQAQAQAAEAAAKAAQAQAAAAQAQAQATKEQAAQKTKQFIVLGIAGAGIIMVFSLFVLRR